MEDLHLSQKRTFTTDITNKVGETVHVYGWVDSIRNHGGVCFFHLRDSRGIIQVVQDNNIQYISKIDEIKSEYCVEIFGKVVKRDAANVNKDIIGGDVEIQLLDIKILAKSDPIPFEISKADEVSEDLQMQYRYLFTRNQKVHKRMLKCIDIIEYLRELLISLGFKHFDTPILTASSPEGARDFLIPSRLHHGRYYALPQAPQIFKQLLIIGGYEKYFQVAHVFRDEDARKDRCYGEFMQLDVEMAFPEIEDLYKIICFVADKVFAKFSDKERTFSSINYMDAIQKYGSDKPDLRNPLIIEDFTEFFKDTQMSIFKKIIDKGGKVKGIRLNSVDQPNKVVELNESWGSRVAYACISDGKITGSIGNFVTPDIFKTDEEQIFFICDEEKSALTKAGLLRNSFVETEDIAIKDEWNFVMVKNFPMYEQSDNTSTGWDFAHNPFSKPQNPNDPIDQILAYQYDLVCNGYEVLSGAIRNHNLESLIDGFNKCGYEDSEVAKRFPSLYNALRFGAPPSGGFAFGVERLLMLLTGTDNVRKICHFPMNTKGVCLLTGAPSSVYPKQLDELQIMNKTPK